MVIRSVDNELGAYYNDYEGSYVSSAVPVAAYGDMTFSIGTMTISIKEPWLHRYYREMNEKVRR